MNTQVKALFMKKLFVAATLLLAVQAVQAQQKKQDKGNEAARAAQRLGGAWTLQWMNGEDLNRLYPTRKPIVNINPALGKIAGFNGCNNYFGTIKVDNKSLSLTSPLGTTKMACTEVDESKFMNIISRIKSFQVNDSNRLELITDKGVELKFTRLPKSSTPQKPSN